MDLQEIYKEESGYDVGRYNIDNNNYYSEDYVEWLEKNLRRCWDVCSKPAEINSKKNIKMINSSTKDSNNSKPVLPAVFFFGIKVVRYRIVKDDYLGYECQIWRLWFPFWLQMNFINTHHTLEKAIEFIENHRKVVIVMSS